MSTLVGAARTHVGNSLRMVITYSRDDYEIRYLRDDVSDEYTAEKLADIQEHVLLEGIGEPFVESLFDDRSRCCQMCMFEELLVCHFNVDDERGYGSARIGTPSRAWTSSSPNADPTRPSRRRRSGLRIEPWIAR